MIVRELDGRILLIRQPDHAHLAAHVMKHCTALAANPRCEAILHAIAQHDGGWAVEDADPHVDPALGTILDFVHTSTEIRQGVWPRGVALLAERDPWAAALVAQHAYTVYQRLRESAEWQPFFTRMLELRDEMLLQTGGRLEDLEADYVYVRLGDLISLTFCTASNDLAQFGDWNVTRSGNRVLVSPDPFDGEEIPMSVAAMEIPMRKYRTDEELHAVLKHPRTITLHGVVSGRLSS